MQVSQYLDEDYFRIQDYLSTLVEGLPTIGLDTAYDKDSLIKSLLRQNKSYANQIIFLCKTLDSIKASEGSRRLPDNVTSGVSLDFVEHLKDKIREYEYNLESVSAENQRLHFQLKELAQKEERSYQQRNDRHHYATGLIQKVSPLRRSNVRADADEISNDIENLLQEGDIEKASEILTQIDYRRPYNVGVDRFNTWLVMANQLKDAKLSEIGGKVRNIADIIESETAQKRGESFDILSFFSVDKLLHFIEEKLSEVLISRNQSEKSGTYIREEQRYRIDSMGSHVDDFDNENLENKVKVLKENLGSMETELQDKHNEIESLKERLNKVKGGHSRQGSNYTKENLLKESEEKEKEKEKIRVKLENDLKEVTNERNELKETTEVLLKENKEFSKKIQELSDQTYEKDQLISKLVLEGEKIKREHNIQEEQENVQKLKEELKFKEAELSALARQIVSLQEAKNPNPEPRESARRSGPATTGSEETLTKGSKETLTFESALHVQGTLLFNLDKVLKDLKTSLKEILAKINISLPQEVDFIFGSNDGLNNARADSHKILRENNNTIQSLLKEAYFIKSACQGICVTLTEQDKISLEDVRSVTIKLRKEEDKLIERLSKCLKTLPLLKVSVNNALNFSQIPQSGSSRALSLLHELYTNMEQVISNFPEISSEVAALEKRPGNKEEGSTSKKLHRMFKDQLLKDQRELTNAIKASGSQQNMETGDVEEISRPSNVSEDGERLSRLFQENCNRMSRIVSMLTKGLGKASESISQLARIADSEDAFVLVGDALNEVDVLRTQVQELGIINQVEGSKAMGVESRYVVRQNQSRNENVRYRGDFEGSRPGERSFKQRSVRASYQESSEVEEMNESLMRKVENLERKNHELNSSYEVVLKKSKEEINGWIEEKQNLVLEIQRKEQEIVKMNQLVDSLRSLSNKQLEVVKDKEEKLSVMTSQKKSEEETRKELEKKVEELTREKSEFIAKKLEELEDVTRKYAKLREEYRNLEEKHGEASDQNRVLKGSKEEIEKVKHEMGEKVRKLNELLQVTRNELRNSRQLAQDKNGELMGKEEEIQALRDSLKKERGLNKESEFVVHLKNELQAQGSELNNLRKKNADLIKTIEHLRAEIQALSYRKDPYIRDVSSERKREQSEDYESLQKSLRRRDAQYNIEKNSQRSEVRSLKNNTFSGSTRDTETQDKEFKTLSTTYTEPRHLKGKTLMSPRDLAIMSGREHEARSLTTTMRDLTKNVGISQEPQYKRHHSVKYLSP